MTSDYTDFFKSLGRRIRELRENAAYSKHDMVSLGFSARQFAANRSGAPNYSSNSAANLRDL